MARQPFHPTYKGTPTMMGPDLIENLPRLAQLVGRITINWSGVDLHLSLLLGSMIGVQNAAAVAVFLSLRNHRAQRDALIAAADKTLFGLLKELFDALMIIHRRLDGQRNDVVHCVWGQAPATPDQIIWESLQDHANMLIIDYQSAHQMTGEERVRNMTKNMYVQRYKDLELLNSHIMAFTHAIRNLHAHLRYVGQIAGDNALQQLCSEPLIQEALAQMRSPSGKSPPESP